MNQLRPTPTLEVPANTPVNSLGNPRRRTTVGQLSGWRLEQFLLQLVAWRAGDAYVRAVTANVTYGVPVSPEARQAWDAARDRLASSRPQVAQIRPPVRRQPERKAS